MPNLNFVLPHWLYWGTLIVFPFIAMYLVKRQRARGEPRAVPPLTHGQVRALQRLRPKGGRTRPLDVEVVRRIRALRAAGASVNAIAAEVSVSVHSVRTLLSGRYYRDVV